MNQFLTYFIVHSPLFYFIQSLWRDEAFSVLVAEKPINAFFGKLSFEPPVYYLLLHFWMKIFGESEIAIRSLSFIAVALATVVVIEWADKMFKKSWIAIFLPLFFIINPMLIYYAFEVRTYGWYILFAILSMYAYLNRKWSLYIISIVLGFYTHTYFVFTILSQITHYAIFNFRKLSKQPILPTLIKDQMIRSIFIGGISMLPWIIKIFFDLGRLKQSWYYPVDIHLVGSVLGNLFLGYEGTPWYLWKYTAWLSIILLGFFYLAWKNRQKREITLYFLINVFLPLTLVIGISFIKPLFVNRYVIPVTISMVFLICIGLENILNKLIRSIIASLLMIAIISFNAWYPQEHPKIPIRDTMTEINRLRSKTDSIYATSSLVFFETVYYSKDRKNVYLYNPGNSPFPWYVGDAAYNNSYTATNLPIYPKRAFMIYPDGSFKVAFTLSGNSDKTGNTTQ
jgi:mannosyltransferase